MRNCPQGNVRLPHWWEVNIYSGDDLVSWGNRPLHENFWSVSMKSHDITMGLLPDTQNCGLCMRRECRERFSRHRLLRKSLVCDPGMHHGTCVMYVAKKAFLAFPAHAQPAILRIWQEVHGLIWIKKLWHKKQHCIIFWSFMFPVMWSFIWCYLRNNFSLISGECKVSGETAKLLLHSVTSWYEGCFKTKKVFWLFILLDNYIKI